MRAAAALWRWLQRAGRRRCARSKWRDRRPGRLAGPQQIDGTARAGADPDSARGRIDDNITGSRHPRRPRRDPERRTLPPVIGGQFGVAAAWCSMRPPGRPPASMSSAPNRRPSPRARTAVERLEVMADQIVARLGLFAARTSPRRFVKANKATPDGRSTNRTERFGYIVLRADEGNRGCRRPPAQMARRNPVWSPTPAVRSGPGSCYADEAGR